MKTNVKVVIGANFGDEGKGLMTDYFCHETSKPVLNIRFNGGAQAGHTVTNEDGRRHVFSHFGAGSFNKNADTYLSKYFIANPIVFRRELDKLAKLGIKPRVFISPLTRVTKPQDMMLNQFVEERRRGNKHGSCGLGVFETIKRYESNKRGSEFLIERMSQLNMKELTIRELELLNDKNILSKYYDDLEFFMNYVTVVPNEKDLFSGYENIVFEGAQGLLLDRNNLDYFPNLTPSNTGLHNVNEMLPFIKEPDIEVCYTTRTYFTRHGAGRFETETNKIDIVGDSFNDNTNIDNIYQDSIRYGYFDSELFKKTILNDVKFLGDRDYSLSIAVTHCNVTNGFIVCKPNKVPTNRLPEILFGGRKVGQYLSNSKTCSGVIKVS